MWPAAFALVLFPPGAAVPGGFVWRGGGFVLDFRMRGGYDGGATRYG